MNILTAINREKRKLEKQLGKLEHRLDGVNAAVKALAHSASAEFNSAKKRVLSAAAREKISMAAKRRWAKVRAGTRKPRHDSAPSRPFWISVGTRLTQEFFQHIAIKVQKTVSR